jgi:SAM-dependent methyltransferase
LPGRLPFSAHSVTWIAGRDLTANGFNDGAYDLIYCSNVLEHAKNDRAAMAKLHRILAPGGLAIIQVPIRGTTTLEDPSVLTPSELARLFGQADQVGYDGSDIEDRLHATGVRVEEASIPDCLKPTAATLKRYNIIKSEPVHFCRKARADA